MTSVPVPTFVPQDAWYSLTQGTLNPNIADSVPVAADLLPYTDSTGTLQDGIVGSLDGGVIYLAGTAAQLDGGQKWLMWEAASLAVSDGVTVFCPFTDSSKPGRWISTDTVSQTSISTTLIVAQGSTSTLASTRTTFNTVFIHGGTAADTSIALPATTFFGQQWTIKDSTGDATAHPITVVGPIDGGTSDSIATNYSSRTYTWNGTEWGGT